VPAEKLRSVSDLHPAAYRRRRQLRERRRLVAQRAISDLFDRSADTSKRTIMTNHNVSIELTGDLPDMAPAEL
jgi:hypothetical protein